MSSITPLLLIGILLLLAGASLALIFSWHNAAEGYEDATGFHQVPTRSRKPTASPAMKSAPIGIVPSPRA